MKNNNRFLLTIRSILGIFLLTAFLIGFLGYYSCSEDDEHPLGFYLSEIKVSGELKTEELIELEAVINMWGYENYIINFNWTVILEPEGSTLTINGENTEVLSLSANVEGLYEFKCTAKLSNFSNEILQNETKSIQLEITDYGKIILIKTPIQNTQIESIPFPISFQVSEDFVGDYTALIQIDGVLDSSFLVNQTDFSYDKGCLPAGQHEIKAILRDNGINGYQRIDSSSVTITVPEGLCTPEPETQLSIIFESPEDYTLIRSIPFEVRIRANSEVGLVTYGVIHGDMGTFYDGLSALEVTQTFMIEGATFEIGPNEIIAQAEDIEGHLAYDTLLIDWQPVWSVTSFFPTSVYPYNSIAFTYNGEAFIGMGSTYGNFTTSADIYKYRPGGNPELSVITAYPGDAREGGVHFTIGPYTYIGLGAVSIGNTNDQPLNEFYRYDPQNNSWTRFADFPGQGRFFAVAFVLNGKGYVGSGSYYNNFMYEGLTDFWEYDPGTGNWSRVADLPATPRHKAFSFSVNGKGYVGGGEATDLSGFFRDLWEFDGNSWTRKNDMPFADPQEGVSEGKGVVWNNRGFVVGGIGYLTFNEQGLWSYDPVNNDWTTGTSGPFAAYDGQSHYAFVIDGLIYTGTVRDYQLDRGNIWVYNPQQDLIP